MRLIRLLTSAAFVVAVFACHSSYGQSAGPLTKAPFCMPDNSDAQTPTQFAICADPKGIVQINLVSIINMINDESIPDALKEKLNERLGLLYQQMSSECGTQVECLESYSAKFQSDTSRMILKALASGSYQKPDPSAATADAASPDTGMQPAQATPDAMADMATPTVDTNSPKPPVRLSNLSVNDMKALTLLNAVNEGAIQVGGIEIWLGKDAEVRDMANAMIKDHGDVKKDIAKKFAYKTTPSETSQWYVNHFKEVTPELSKMTKGEDEKYLKGELALHKRILADLNAFKPDDTSPAVATEIGTSIKVFTRHLQMAQALVNQPKFAGK